MTVNMIQLWLPIIAGGLLVWLASGLIHMMLKYHNHDYLQLSNEDEVTGALRNGSPAPGVYTTPFCIDMSQMKDEAMQKRFMEGPVAFITVFPKGMPPMGKLMTQQIAYSIVGCLLIAYCATLALAPGAQYTTVFRFVAATGFLAFGWATIPFGIWYGLRWPTIGRYLLDALIYALVAAGTFAWLWP